MSRPVPQRWSPGEIKRLRELRDGAQLPGMISGALATIDALEAQVAALTAAVAAEREACAAACRAEAVGSWSDPYTNACEACAEAIEARGGQ